MGPRVQVSGSCYVVAMGCGHTQCGCYGVWSLTMWLLWSVALTMWLLWSVVTHNVVAMECGHTQCGCYGVWSHAMWSHYVVAMECGHMLWGCYVVCGEVRDRAKISLVLISVLPLLLQQI